MEMVKVAAMGIGAVLLALQFKQVRAEYGIYIGLAAGFIIFGFALTKVVVVVQGIEKAAALMSVDSKYIRLLIKAAGIAYICEFSSSLCRDSGCSSVASQIEMAGRLTILVLSMPVITALLDTINSFLK